MVAFSTLWCSIKVVILFKSLGRFLEELEFALWLCWLEVLVTVFFKAQTVFTWYLFLGIYGLLQCCIDWQDLLLVVIVAYLRIAVVVCCK